ncbi:unnamed protein product [Prunus armeniaca]|uniref:Uncharacterized protein n=1 Tax=Prunus armeniaca TaxID=36596 RepID=A0A6J5Y7U1_PRUAR|nr:unnamed protein product [Prunus armeniaca]
MSADPDGHLHYSFEAELCYATPEVLDRSPPKPERTISDHHDQQTSAPLVMLGPGGKATSSGKRAIELNGTQEEGHGDNQNLESESVEDDNFLIPLNMTGVEDATGGTSEEKAAPKVKAQAAAPATRRKRKRGEDPKTYVPLAFREKKCQEYYFYEYA